MILRAFIVRGSTYALLLLGLAVLRIGLRATPGDSSGHIHSTSEALATLLALMVGTLALLRFYSRRSALHLFLGMGFLGVALLDGYHVVVTHPLFLARYDFDRTALHAAGWSFSWLYLGVMLLLSWWLSREKIAIKEPRPKRERWVFALSGVALLLVFWAQMWYPLPPDYYSAYLWGRPLDLLAGIFLLGATAGYLGRMRWVQSTLDHWLILSLIFAVGSHLICMGGSGTCFDGLFDLAHMLKVAAYACAVIGLLIDVYRLFHFAERSRLEMVSITESLRNANSRLESTHRELREAKDRYEMVIEGASEGIWHWDMVLWTFWGSDQFHVLLALPKEDALNSLERFRALVHPDDRPGQWDRFETNLRQGLSYDLELRFRVGDNGYRWFRLRARVERNERGDPIRAVGSLVDVTHQKESFQHATLHGVMGISLAVNLSLKSILKRCSDALVTHLRLTRSRIWTWREEEKYLELVAFSGSQPEGEDSIALNDGLIGMVAGRGEPYIVDNIRDSMETESSAFEDGSIAFGGFPLLVGDRLVGILGVWSRSPLSEMTRETLGSLSNGLAVGIDRVHNEEKLKENERLFRGLAEHLDGAVWIHRRRDLRLLYISPGWERMTGQPASELKQSYERWLEVVHEEDRPRVQAALTKRRETGIYDEKFRIRHRLDGTIRWIWDKAFPIYNSAGEPTRIGGIALDITEQMAITESLQQVKDDLERSNQELDDFAYVASHDLKAPLRQIGRLCDWLVEDLGEGLTPESQRHLDQLHQRAQRMARLLTDLLDYSRAGRLHDTIGEVDVGDIIRRVVDLIPFPEGFRIDIETPMPVMVTEAVPLETIFRNLLSNALKHHHQPEHGHIRISAEEHRLRTTFFVRDNGPGIAETHHDLIFRMFSTLQSRDKVEGSGMGLAIVKKLVHHYGGSVSVQSEPGKGTTFRFDWPAMSGTKR